MKRDSSGRLSTTFKFSDFTVEQDRVLLKFILQNSTWYNRHEIFQKAQEQNPILAEKTVLDLYLRFHRVLFPLFTGKPSDEKVELITFQDGSEDFEVEEDRALLKFVMKNSKKYDKWSIFQAAQENESVLRQKTILELYLRYHRFLFPLFTGKLSDESVPLQYPLEEPEESEEPEVKKEEAEDAKLVEAMEDISFEVRSPRSDPEEAVHHKIDIFEKKAKLVQSSKDGKPSIDDE
uniref:ARID domain-containing protein n=1 Tax=Caenorhabditis tropicalis TaxID=1561998 RepID=A0A1I7UE35_9PELO